MPRFGQQVAAARRWGGHTLVRRRSSAVTIAGPPGRTAHALEERKSCLLLCALLAELGAAWLLRFLHGHETGIKTHPPQAMVLQRAA